ncbi:MAG: RnfH family protein [Gammaproteobacteria bacterium]|nr:RnfH family protein [Gammaproteobacteria bacterium]MYF02473.1 RnfH family protein [Gammaproteobacteria bacterium]MYI77428.1 RnfH family protein [Gammaproteobacteria bacterium]
MRVNVVYATVGQTWEVDLDCPTGTRVREAVELAVAHEEFVGVDLSGDETFAVWNKVVEQDHVLQDGDRVEILRELVISPMQRRRLYAKLNTSE